MCVMGLHRNTPHVNVCECAAQRYLTLPQTNYIHVITCNLNKLVLECRE